MSEHDDYLFDPEAPPDPAVQELERKLAQFRRTSGALRPPEEEAPRRAWTGRRARPAWLAAAALLLAGATIFLLVRERGGLGDRGRGVDRSETGVTIADSSGAVRRDGDHIVCDEGGRARLRVGDIGFLTLEERTRVRLVAGHEEGEGQDAQEEKEGAFRLDLERGTVSALIFAAPRVFWLGTPSGIAVDLGCVYRTTVDDEGHTTLAVVTGRVSFESDGRKVYVPAGASCRAWPGFGPGTPAWDDADAEFRAAVVRHDEARMMHEPAAARRAIEELLVTEKPRDSLTLWHLLDAPELDLRSDVYERLRDLCPPPADCMRADCLALDPESLAAWREQLEADCW